jgi:hypothetical protein
MLTDEDRLETIPVWEIASGAVATRARARARGGGGGGVPDKGAAGEKKKKRIDSAIEGVDASR